MLESVPQAFRVLTTAPVRTGLPFPSTREAQGTIAILICWAGQDTSAVAFHGAGAELEPTKFSGVL